MTTDSGLSQNAFDFRTTHWSRVCLAKAESEDGRAALAELCEGYYEPIIAYLRCVLRQPDAARDMAHAFFARLLQGGAIDAADQERGPFRTYLLGAVKHFLSHQREHQLRLKRGGGVDVMELDDAAAQGVADPKGLSPDAAFDQQWALTVLMRALEALRNECAEEGRTALFERIKPWLTGECAYGDQATIAASCGLSPAAFRVAVHRMKHRFRQWVKVEVGRTLTSPAAVEAEMRNLFAALGG